MFQSSKQFYLKQNHFDLNRDIIIVTAINYGLVFCSRLCTRKLINTHVTIHVQNILIRFIYVPLLNMENLGPEHSVTFAQHSNT